MAIMDYLTQFGVDVDLDSETATVLLPNQVDLGMVGKNLGGIGVASQLYVNFVVTEAFTDGADGATANFQVRSDASAAIHATSSSLHASTGPMLKAALTLGASFSIPLPNNGGATPYEQYLGVQAVIETAGFDAGMVTCWLGLQPVNGWKPFTSEVG